MAEACKSYNRWMLISMATTCCSGELKGRVRKLIRGFKGDGYAFGIGVIDRVGEYAAEFGKTALVVANHGAWFKPVIDPVVESRATG